MKSKVKRDECWAPGRGKLQAAGCICATEFGLAQVLTGLQGEKALGCLKLMPILAEAVGSLQHTCIPVVITHHKLKQFPRGMVSLLFEPLEAG